MTSSTILLVLHVKHCVLGEIMNIYVEILHVLLLHVSPTSRFFCRHYMSFLLNSKICLCGLKNYTLEHFLFLPQPFSLYSQKTT